MKKLYWVGLVIIVLFLGSALYHSRKYHSKTDGFNKLMIAYRGIEQFSHSHNNEHLLELEDLTLFLEFDAIVVDAELEPKGYSRRFRRDGNGINYSWKYRSSTKKLEDYEVVYSNDDDTITVSYLIPEWSYYNQMIEEIRKMSAKKYPIARAKYGYDLYMHLPYDIAILTSKNYEYGDNRYSITVSRWKDREYMLKDVRL
jgi:hypothetical protein